MWFVLLLWAVAGVVGLVDFAQNPPSWGCVIRDDDWNIRLHRTLVFVSGSYFSLFENWLAFYREACSGDTSSLLLMCIDDSAVQQLERSIPELNCTLISQPSPVAAANETDGKGRQLSLIWMERMQLVTALLRQGVDLVLSDTDSIWLRNPFLELSKQGMKAPIVSSRGWYPRSLWRLWGSTLCMGFIYIRSQPSTVHFFESVLQHMQDTHTTYLSSLSGQANCTSLDVRNLSLSKPARCPMADDQLSVNWMLYRHNVVWPRLTRPHYRVSTHVGRFQSNGSWLSVALLAEDSFVRNCAGMSPFRPFVVQFPSQDVLARVRKRLSTATIAHCMLDTGDSAQKEAYLTVYALWKAARNVSQAQAFIAYHYAEMQRNKRNVAVAAAAAERQRARNASMIRRNSSMEGWQPQVRTASSTGDVPRSRDSTSSSRQQRGQRRRSGSMTRESAVSTLHHI